MGTSKKELKYPDPIPFEEITQDEEGLRNGLKRLIPIAVTFASQGCSAYATFLTKVAEKLLPEWGKNKNATIPADEYAKMFEQLIEKKSEKNDDDTNL